MTFMILAHAGLIAWDEFLFLGIAMIFTGLMVYSYRKSQAFDPELEDDIQNHNQA